MRKPQGEVTREAMPTQWDIALRRRSLFQHWVAPNYELVDGLVHWVDDADYEGGGYLPMATPAIVGDFVRLRIGDTDGLLAFVRRWGHLGYVDLLLRDNPPKAVRAYGDPVAWVWAHVAGLQTALMLWKCWREKDAKGLARYLNKKRVTKKKWFSLNRLDALLRGGRFVDAQCRIEEHVSELAHNERKDGYVVFVAGNDARVRTFSVLQDADGEITWEEAWGLIRHIINPNLRGVHAQISSYFDKIPGDPIVALGFDSLMSVIYRHVFEIMASGEVEECQECATPFIRSDGRQRFCLPTPPARESLCAMRFHKREQRQRAGKTRRAR